MDARAVAADPLLPALDGAFGDPAEAVSVDGRAITWSGLRAAAAAVAERVAGASAVAVHAAPSLETVVAVAGGLLAGTPVVPVPPDSGPDERAHLLRDSGAELVLGADWPELPSVPVDVAARGTFTGAEPGPDEAAFVLYTSGTTGPPKGAVIPRRAVAAGLDGFGAALGWTPDDVLAHGLPLFHVHGLVLGVLGPLRLGSRLVHTGRPLPERYAAAGGSLYFGVPTVWSRVAADPASARALSAARLLVSGSAPLPVPVFERVAALTGLTPLERYGMTETLITISARHDGARRPGVVGVPIAGVEARIAGDELEIRGATVFDGYHGNPGATAAALTPDGWFRTGDVALADDAGHYRILGRASTDLIKSGGYKIGAGEVEDALLAHPAVREAAVLGAPDDDLGERVVAFVVADGVTAAELETFVGERLSRHKRPREVRFVETLPRNAMGKLLKTALR